MNHKGIWEHDNERLKNNAFKFYLGLFCSEPASFESFIRGRFLVMGDKGRRGLMKELSIEETWAALKSMGSLKVQGPDGYHSFFFKWTWQMIGPALNSFVKDILEGEHS